MLTYSKPGTTSVSFAYVESRKVFVVKCGAQRVECNAAEARAMGAKLEKQGYAKGAPALPSDPTDLVIALANRGY